MNQVQDDVPLAHHGGYTSSPQVGMHHGGNDVIRRAEEHQSELVAAVSQMQQVNGRVLMEKSEDVNKLASILQNCQAMLQRLISENESVQIDINRLDSQKRQITSSIETVQEQIADEMAKQQRLHQALKAGGAQSGAMRPSMPGNPAVGRVSMESPMRPSLSPGKPGFGQVEVDFQNEFNNADWGGFDNNFANQGGQAPNGMAGAGNSLFG